MMLDTSSSHVPGPPLPVASSVNLRPVAKTAGNKRKRVVPDALRRRTAVSCDRCKLRRAKCIRNSTEEDCSNCLNAGVPCESTLPRKHRVYGSLESLSLRYRALDALVKGLLPNEDVRDVDVLIEIGRKRGIQMPDHESLETNPEIFHNVPQAPPTPVSDNQANGVRTQHSSTPPLRATPKRIRDEKLVHAPHGVGHYVGPSSSLGFAAVVRKMVARIMPNQKFMLSRRQQRTLATDFVNSNRQKTMNSPDNKSPTPIDSTQAQLRPQDGGVYMRVLDAQEKDDPNDIVFNLPDQATAQTLIRTFFDHVHTNYPLFHIPLFWKRYEAMWTSNTHPNESDPGWICVLCLVFVFGAQASDPYGKASDLIQKRYLKIARCYVDHLVSTTSMQNIQALMLLQLYYHNVGERNASWMLLGCATRMAIALGMHREGANVGFDGLEQNIRKQIWWTVYVFERNLCIILGRPSAIEESEITITFPEEAVESSIGLPGLTAVTVSLTRLAFRAKQEIYNPSELRSPSDASGSVVDSARVLLRDLQHWYERLPQHLRVNTHAAHAQQARAVLLLDIQYQHTRSLVTRPFLISRVNKQIEMVEQQTVPKQPQPTMSDEAVGLASQCVADAHTVVKLGLRLIKEGVFNGTGWLDVYYLYQSCFVVCLDFIPQLADIPESKEDLQRKADVNEIYTEMRRRPLAASFRTFTQVGSQFASLVGALHNVSHDSMSNANVFADLSFFTGNGSTARAANAPIAAMANATPISAPAYPVQQNNHMITYHTEPPVQTSAGRMTNQQDWMNATQIPWDFLGQTNYGRTHGFSEEWYAVQAGTYDDMMFPTVVGGNFGQNPAGSMMNEWGSNGFRMGYG